MLYEVPLGLIGEILAALDIFRYNGFITDKEFLDAEVRLSSISNRLGGFKRKLAVCR